MNWFRDNFIGQLRTVRRSRIFTDQRFSNRQSPEIEKWISNHFSLMMTNLRNWWVIGMMIHFCCWASENRFITRTQIILDLQKTWFLKIPKIRIDLKKKIPKKLTKENKILIFLPAHFRKIAKINSKIQTQIKWSY